MKSIAEFENFKVEGLKYFTGGGATGAGEVCINGGCVAYDHDKTDSKGKTIEYYCCTGVVKPCEE